jgi:ribosomal protein S20
MRQDVVRRERNRGQRSALRRVIRQYREMATQDRAGAYNGLQSSLDKAVGKGIISQNKAARLKSRLAPAGA